MKEKKLIEMREKLKSAKRIQMEFATIAIKEGQEKIVKKIIKRYGNRKLGEY